MHMFHIQTKIKVDFCRGEINFTVCALLLAALICGGGEDFIDTRSLWKHHNDHKTIQSNAKLCRSLSLQIKQK